VGKKKEPPSRGPNKKEKGENKKKVSTLEKTTTVPREEKKAVDRGH